ncbi:MAG TPA: YdcF family protein [Ruminococcaceae bacterium]|nr:YdcF family protein [Oscillospiraceae bacterium]
MRIFKKTVQITLIALELLIIFTFAFSLFRNVNNIGVIFGLFMFSALLAVTVFWQGVKALVKKIMAHRGLKILFFSLCGIFGALVIYAFVLSGLMLKSALTAPQNPDVAIVLGCKVQKSGNPSLMLSKRIDAAYEFLSDNPDVICIVSGGQGPDEPASEAEIMKSRLTERGISEERIIAEDKSESTRENIENSIAILKEKNIDAAEAAIVTDGFHQLRAALIAKEYDLVPTAVNAETPPWLAASYWIREWFALSHRFVFGS